MKSYFKDAKLCYKIKTIGKKLINKSTQFFGDKINGMRTGYGIQYFRNKFDVSISFNYIINILVFYLFFAI
jgi:hypothetical protein